MHCNTPSTLCNMNFELIRKTLQHTAAHSNTLQFNSSNGLRTAIFATVGTQAAVNLVFGYEESKNERNSQIMYGLALSCRLAQLLGHLFKRNLF